jgi:hypothetical protein
MPLNSSSQKNLDPVNGENYWVYWCGQLVIVTYDNLLGFHLMQVGPRILEPLQIISHIEKPPDSITPINGETYWLHRRKGNLRNFEIGEFIAATGRWNVGGVSFFGGEFEPVQHIPKPGMR